MRDRRCLDWRQSCPVGGISKVKCTPSGRAAVALDAVSYNRPADGTILTATLKGLPRGRLLRVCSGACPGAGVQAFCGRF